jgi:hypothetical protein
MKRYLVEEMPPGCFRHPHITIGSRSRRDRLADGDYTFR